MVVRHHGRIVADIPAKLIASESPVYHREAREPTYLAEVRAFSLEGVPDCAEPAGALRSLLRWPTLASKNWIYRQYDHMVRDGSVVCPGSDAAVVRIKSDSVPVSADPATASPVREKFIALTVDGNGAYVYLDPYEGGRIAVAEAARNLACSGAVPLGVTDNLNYANPHNPELFWQLKESVRGLADACRALNTPVTGGNCSLYNQSPGGPIDPTPTIAMVGLIERHEHITTQWFKDERDVVLLLGDPVDATDPLLGLGGSAYLQVMHRRKTGRPPRCDLEREQLLIQALRGWIASGVVKSAHDCSEGGLAFTLAEACISQQIGRNTPRLIGANIDLSGIPAVRQDGLLFGETQGRAIITVAHTQVSRVLGQARILGLPACQIGTVGGTELVVKTAASEFRLPTAEMHELWWNAIAREMGA
jgi:phosphoribosylformylglycinamidine synthase